MREADCLHRAFFGGDAPAVVRERYAAAVALCSPEPSALVDAVIANGLDVEAVELFLRLHTGPSALTKRVQILFYLVEVRSAYYAYFSGNGEGRLRAVTGLLVSVAQTASKYLKGAYLVRRYGLLRHA